MALTLITEAQIKSRKGFSYYVGVGNEADIKFHEYLEFFREDPDTRGILMYVEGMRNGRNFLQEAYKTTHSKTHRPAEKRPLPHRQPLRRLPHRRTYRHVRGRKRRP